MSLSLDFNQIKPLIECDSLILTPNSRTQKAIITGQLVDLPADAVVEIVKVSSFNQWLDALWVELSFHLTLPKRIGSLVIKSWLENEIAKENAWTLTNPSGVASKALEAYKNLSQWDLILDDLEKSENSDSVEVEYFIKWLRTLEDFCRQNQLMADFLSLHYIKQNIKKLAGVIPKDILMVGFEHLTPLEESFLKELVELGISVGKYNYEIEETSSKQIGFSCFREEIEFAARYAKEYVERNVQKNEDETNSSANKSGVLGIVVDQLATNLGDVHAAFSREFHPEESKPWVAIQKPDYNVSAGFSLAEQPLVVAALTLLSLNNYQIGRDELHFLKNTPFIQWHADDSERKVGRLIKQFLHQQCLSPRKMFSIKSLLEKIEEHELRESLQPLADILNRLFESKNTTGNISKHIENWKLRLSSWQWIGLTDVQGQKHLNEFEIKTCNEFFDAMEQTKEIEHITKGLSANEAFGFLNQQVMNKTFQIASDHSSVQILGVLEASGLQFDELIVVGFNADNWPQRNKINPFLPLDFQRRHNMPGSSAQREFDYAKALSMGLLKSSKNIIVTSNNESVNHTNNEAIFFSKLARVCSNDLVRNTLVDTSSKKTDSDSKNYEWIEDSWIDSSDTSHFGGTYLLSEYAQCPFRAIANNQLKLNGYPEPELGIDSRAKGTWLHDTMEIIWGKLKSQELIALNADQLERIVLESIDAALDKHKEFLLIATNTAVLEIEKRKLYGLVSEWLTLEKEREKFEVKALEKEYEFSIEGLSLNFRIDRIDGLITEDSTKGSCLALIDYKSGKVNVNQWFGVRPTEAQMPAYILALDHETKGESPNLAKTNIGALSYAQIKTGDVSIQGILFSSELSNDSVMKQIHSLEKQTITSPVEILNKTYPQLLDDWKSTLGRVAYGISEGWIPVSPKDNSVCKFCDYRAICRIDENQPYEVMDTSELENSAVTKSQRQESLLSDRQEDDSA